MKKIIFNIDKFLINYFKKIALLASSHNLLYSIIGIILSLISIIIFLVPIVLLELIYLFIDREKLKKTYEKEKKKGMIKNE